MLALWLQYLDKMEYELGLYSFRQFIVNRMPLNWIMFLIFLDTSRIDEC